MSRKPMTVKQLREALSQQPDNLFVAWVNDGTVGYFYAVDQDMTLDNGHVHLECGSCAGPQTIDGEPEKG